MAGKQQNVGMTLREALNGRVKCLLFDFAGVLAQHQPMQARRNLTETAGVNPEIFWRAYWNERTPYDAGAISARNYWGRVSSRVGVTWSTDQIRMLGRLDIASWLSPDAEMLELLPQLSEKSLHLAILSNAPHELATAVEKLDWVAPFNPLIFSCRLGVTKPDRRCYESAIRLLDIAANEVLFIDDRQENVSGAAAIGMQSALFCGALQLRDQILDAPSG
ncbi:putative hydrolase of the HAD superfamily [Streptomyces sp. LBL]|uniref:HAD family hydrolase n=1 Tax=Streptomyces sp. LBL TaxID=2940562 RepID=UPI00247502A5|nr:HAD family phosphatase [Streptomyces sp. LBL]MDH6628334.1 putative hydrolase of the HAD superfamily [Streptomyces sp. LBL]